MTALDVDPSRAEKAARALRNGDVRIEAGSKPGTYEVQSFSRDRTYRVQLNDRLRCDCPDATYNGTRACKHTLAVVLAAGLNGRMT